MIVKFLLKKIVLILIRRHPDLNWGIKDLQSSALPLGYTAKTSLSFLFLLLTKEVHLLYLNIQIYNAATLEF